MKNVLIQVDDKDHERYRTLAFQRRTTHEQLWLKGLEVEEKGLEQGQDATSKKE